MTNEDHFDVFNDQDQVQAQHELEHEHEQNENQNEDKDEVEVKVKDGPHKNTHTCQQMGSPCSMRLRGRRTKNSVCCPGSQCGVDLQSGLSFCFMVRT